MIFQYLPRPCSIFFKAQIDVNHDYREVSLPMQMTLVQQMQQGKAVRPTGHTDQQSIPVLDHAILKDGLFHPVP